MTRRRINLALQGGGAHGAYTWGVLDRLLEDETIEIAGISGTSAGALNGAALKAGLTQGGPAQAREVLDWVWAQMGAVGDMRLTGWFSSVLPAQGVLTRIMDGFTALTPLDLATRVFSPYASGPFYRNPIERVVSRLHFGHVCSREGPKLFISATNVRTGKLRVFSGDEISTEVILASACLPTLFRAVDLPDPVTGEAEPYWDGGYSGNPALFPLFAEELPRDIVVVNINPLRRDTLPTTPQEIMNRINEISFNSSLLRELRTIALSKEMMAHGTITDGGIKDVLLHMISDDDLMTQLSETTKLVPSPLLLYRLKEAGRAAADRFLQDHSADLGHCSTLKLEEVLD
ncbi:patatin-like phospholipase family protein [Halodurantibacterium flavum]|uniref:Patatin-like phospholipase family protein n=1 Tax=Halodurantibacterium flavum TaxID=1382802 RepID=A0ABW4S5T4_9RHOB